MRVFVLIAVLLALLPTATSAQTPADFAVPGGRFFTQTGGGTGKGIWALLVVKQHHDQRNTDRIVAAMGKR